jgi:D-alanyl-D-alanine carboxypeptidase
MDASRASGRKKRTVGRSSARSPWYPVFAGSLVAVAVSVVVLIVVAVDGLGDGNDGAGQVGATGSPTSEPNSTSAGGAPTTVPAKSAVPPATSSPVLGNDNTPLVRCGDLLAPLDKQHRLAQDCVPAELVTLPASISTGGQQELTRETASAMQEMFSAAKADGQNLSVGSAYRSFQTQADTYLFWVRTNGQEYADRTSALPGHSEHQLGTTGDVCWNGVCLESFAGTPGAKWLADNSWKYGFIVSYPEGKEPVTGYAPEAWHVRFVGKDTAKKVHDSGLTLHEYLLR